MADILFGGLHFNWKRFKKDIDLFKPRKANADTASPLWDWGATTGAAASSSRHNVDSNGKPESVNAGSKCGKPAVAESSEDEEELEEDFDVVADAKESRKKRKAKEAIRDREREVEEMENEENGVELFKGSAAGRRFKDGSGPGKKKPSNAAREQEEAAILRKRLRIHVKGTLVPLPLKSLSELADRSSSRKIRPVIEGLAERGIVEPSPIQRQAIPVLLQGRELFACSATGSGKTLAFLLPLLLRLVDRGEGAESITPQPATQPESSPTADETPAKKKQKKIKGGSEAGKNTPATPAVRETDVDGAAATPSSKAGRKNAAVVADASGPVPARSSDGGVGLSGKGGVRAVVLCPTKELAQQTMREWQKLFHHTAGSSAKAVGLRAVLLTKATAAGVDLSVSAPSPVDILFATPLLLEHLLEAGKVNLKRAEFLVLDEADKLFEMGFVEQVDAILAACDASRLCKALFSATLPDTVEELARTVMHDPVRVTIGERNAAASTVAQKLLFVGREEGKLLAIRQMVKEGLHPPMLIFVASKERANDLFKELAYDDLKVDVIHADRTPAQRAAVVDNFRAGKVWLLITTDVMARGMDFKGVNCVMNFDFPESATSYVHRIGRCGRAGRPGTAITLFTESDAPCLRSIANVMVASGCEVPKWMLSLGLQSKKKKKKHLPRQPISTMAKFDRVKQKNRRDAISSSKKRKIGDEKANA
eukprot:jgi/Mesvir1/20384/Mv12289-RA.1